jgi:hypothetical protein
MNNRRRRFRPESTTRRATVHHPALVEAKACPCSGPRAAGRHPSSRSRREHVPRHCTAAGQFVRRQEATTRCSWHGALSVRVSAPSHGDRGDGASFLSATLLAGRHRPLAAHWVAHSPAHSSASKCWVGSPVARFQTGLAGPASRRPGCRRGAAGPGPGPGRGGRQMVTWSILDSALGNSAGAWLVLPGAVGFTPCWHLKVGEDGRGAARSH